MKSAAEVARKRNAELADALARISLGDRQAFAQLYRHSRAQLFGVILSINADHGRAEEVLQQVFVSVWHGAADSDAARSQPMAWLTGIARDRAIDSLHRRPGPADTAAALDVPDDAPDGPAGDAAEPLQCLQQAGRASRLGECIDRLSPEQQHSLALAFYQGLSCGEVAERLAQPLATVKSRLLSALLALKQGAQGVERDGAG